MCTLQGINISHLGEKENHLQNAIVGGYVSSLEGNFSEIKAVAYKKIAGKCLPNRLAFKTEIPFPSSRILPQDSEVQTPVASDSSSMWFSSSHPP